MGYGAAVQRGVRRTIHGERNRLDEERTQNDRLYGRVSRYGKKDEIIRFSRYAQTCERVVLTVRKISYYFTFGRAISFRRSTV